MMSEEEKDLQFVMERYGRIVNGIIFSSLRTQSEREDIFQEVFLLYYTKELHFTDERARKAWLIRTAVNLCRAADRSPWNLFRSGEEFDPESVRYDESPPDNTELWRAVMRLKEKYRLPLYLHYFEEVPIAEVAEIMRISEGAVKMRLRRAREKLRAALTENERNIKETEAAENAKEKKSYRIGHSQQP